MCRSDSNLNFFCGMNPCKLDQAVRNVLLRWRIEETNVYKILKNETNVSKMLVLPLDSIFFPRKLF